MQSTNISDELDSGIPFLSDLVALLGELLIYLLKNVWTVYPMRGMCII